MEDERLPYERKNLFTEGDQRINRKGRPKAGRSLVDYINVKTRRGKDLVDFYWKVYKDPAEPTDTRLKAAEKLEFRALRKPAQAVEGTIEQYGITLHINVDPLARPDE